MVALEKFRGRSTVIDVSICLRAGAPRRLLAVVKMTPTVVLNGYYGTRLGGGEPGERERENMRLLMGWCDHGIRL